VETIISEGESYNYTGLCLDYLQMTAAKYDMPITNGSVMVKNNPRVNNPDALVNLFTSASIAYPECARDGLPLLCNYFYLVCDNTGHSPAVLSNLEENCTEVSQGSCQQIWQHALNFEIAPDCSNLDGNDIMSSSNITCHPHFDLRCGLCVPTCEDFSETPHHIQTTIDIFFDIAGFIMVIGGALVIIVSIIRREVM